MNKFNGFHPSALTWKSGAAIGVVAAAGLSLYRSAADIVNALGVSRSKLQKSHRGSSHFDGSSFHNMLPSSVLVPDSFLSVGAAMLTRSRTGKPHHPIPLLHDATPATAGDLAVTWYGHASALIELDGHFILTDPVWSERVSPSPSIGPKRLHPMPLPLGSLPPSPQSSFPMITTTIWTCRRCRPWSIRRLRRSWCRSGLAPTYGSGGGSESDRRTRLGRPTRHR